MKCRECGSPRARYKVSRKRYWKGQDPGSTRGPRTDFRVKCPVCGAEYEEKIKRGDGE